MYPVNLQMKGISCLVIGGGHIAFRKVKKLVQEEARVTVLAPEISEELKQLCDEKKSGGRLSLLLPVIPEAILLW